MTYRQEEDHYEILTGDGTLHIYSLSKRPSHPLFSAELLQNFASCLHDTKFYHLEEEKLPSGNHILYTYDEHGNPLSISAYTSEETAPFSQITFEYSKNACRAISDDGRQVIYHFDANGKLVKVQSHQEHISLKRFALGPCITLVQEILSPYLTRWAERFVRILLYALILIPQRIFMIMTFKVRRMKMR